MAFAVYTIYLIFLMSLLQGSVKAQKLIPCNELLSQKNETQDGSENWGVDLQIPPNMCFICTKTKCQEKGTNCSLWSEIESIPLYSNILEFGLLESFLPVEGVILVKINDNCYLRIEIISPFKKDDYNIFIKQCHSLDVDCVYLKNETLSFDASEGTRRCLYVGLAFHGRRRFYTAFSQDCTKIAARNFAYPNASSLEFSSCIFNRFRNKISVHFLFLQRKESDYSGIPVIVPCSPGGSIVDAQSGRFLEGKMCKMLFFHGAEGINFLIREIYDGNENLLFPKYDFQNRALRIPIYMDRDKPKSRVAMTPERYTNYKLYGKTRQQCDYVKCGNGANSSKRCKRYPLSSKPYEPEKIQNSNLQVQSKKEVVETEENQNSDYQASAEIFSVDIFLLILLTFVSQS